VRHTSAPNLRQSSQVERTALRVLYQRVLPRVSGAAFFVQRLRHASSVQRSPLLCFVQRPPYSVPCMTPLSLRCASRCCVCVQRIAYSVQRTAYCVLRSRRCVLCPALGLPFFIWSTFEKTRAHPSTKAIDCIGSGQRPQIFILSISLPHLTMPRFALQSSPTSSPTFQSPDSPTMVFPVVTPALDTWRNTASYVNPLHYTEVHLTAALQVQLHCINQYQRLSPVVHERCDWAVHTVGVACSDLHPDAITLLSTRDNNFITAYLEDARITRRPIEEGYDLTLEEQIEYESAAFSNFVRDHYFDTIQDFLDRREVSRQTYDEWMTQGEACAPFVFDGESIREPYLDFFRPLKGTGISYLAFHAMCAGRCQEDYLKVKKMMEEEAANEEEESFDGYEEDDMDI
jgi:hypothetical protein